MRGAGERATFLPRPRFAKSPGLSVLRRREHRRGGTSPSVGRSRGPPLPTLPGIRDYHSSGPPPRDPRHVVGPGVRSALPERARPRPHPPGGSPPSDGVLEPPPGGGVRGEEEVGGTVPESAGPETPQTEEGKRDRVRGDGSGGPPPRRRAVRGATPVRRCVLASGPWEGRTSAVSSTPPLRRSPLAESSPSRLGNDPSAGSPTETLLRLLLPLNDQVRRSSGRTRPGEPGTRPVQPSH